MNNQELTLLSEGQIWGNYKEPQLEVIRKYGTKAAVTDLCVLTGSYLSKDTIDEDKSLAGRTSWFWTRSDDNDDDVCVVYEAGERNSATRRSRCNAVRPVLQSSVIFSQISPNRVRGYNGTEEVEYGEYPQYAADSKMQNILESEYNNRGMNKTGRSYTFDSVKYDDYDTGFKPVTYEEYEYQGKGYIRIKANFSSDFLSDFLSAFFSDPSLSDNETKLSNGVEYRDGDYVWVEVSPVKWLIDDKTGILISKKGLVSGINFDDSIDYVDHSVHYKGDFDRTFMKEYLDRYMLWDLTQTATFTRVQNMTPEEKAKFEEEQKQAERRNPYGFNFDGVTEEDIIKGAVESNVSVFLHGRSSEGKSARVKQLDPDCEIIYMRNATPDSLNGKSVYNALAGEMIDVPPTWYSKIKEKCEAEPDKIHIIFFDELTNALPSIQGMAFNIILDGEVNGKWKLPANARIVAAGNDLNDSLAANQMAEPLFNRFAHVYINTTVDSWLKWASTPKEKYEKLDYKEEEPTAKIHPSVYAYIAYKSYSGHDVLRTPYTGDKPNADPRKWEMASKVLFKTKQPEMLRALIGDDLTSDFIAFAKQQVISVEDVINHNYSSRDLEMDISQKFATAVGLSSVDDEHFEIVRDFMKQIGAEPRAAFESMWAHGDEKRLEHLAEIQMTDNLSQGEIRK